MNRGGKRRKPQLPPVNPQDAPSSARIERVVEEKVEERFSVLEASYHSGPLPPPAVLEQYDRIIPGAAKTIVEMAERQQIHRHSLEQSHLRGSQRREQVGQVFAFVLSLGVLGVGGILSYLGRAEGFWLIVALMASLAGVFITGKKISIRELLQKRKDLVRGPTQE